MTSEEEDWEPENPDDFEIYEDKSKLIETCPNCESKNIVRFKRDFENVWRIGCHDCGTESVMICEC